MAGRVDGAILDVAARSAGVCTRAELRRAGIADRTIDRRAAAGLLARVGPGVYQVPALTTVDSPYYRAARAHPRGAVSHRSAARLWGFPVPPPGEAEPVEVTVPAGSSVRARVPGVLLHSARRWSAEHLAEPRPGLTATGPARTIVDLASTAITDRRLRHVVQAQVVAGAVTADELGAVLHRVGARGVAGAGRVRRLVDDLGGAEPRPESELERRLAGLLDRRFLRQYRPPWYDGIRGVVDFADPESRVIVEADGRRWHTAGQAMAEDRRRDRIAAASGWLVLRVTWDDVVSRPEATGAQIAATVRVRSRDCA